MEEMTGKEYMGNKETEIIWLKTKSLLPLPSQLVSLICSWRKRRERSQNRCLVFCFALFCLFCFLFLMGEIKWKQGSAWLWRAADTRGCHISCLRDGSDVAKGSWWNEVRIQAREKVKRKTLLNENRRKGKNKQCPQKVQQQNVL